MSNVNSSIIFVSPVKKIIEDRSKEKEGKIIYQTKLFCGHCGKELVSNDYTFCPYCGIMVNKKTELKNFPDYHPCITGITLLSEGEALSLLSKTERMYNSHWWLHSPGSHNRYACSVDSQGDIDRSGRNVYLNDYCVRPALKINLSASDFKIGHIFSLGGKEFKIISDGLAWMYKDDIGKCAFCEDWEAKNANVYEVSDIKKYVENWLHNVIFNKI